MADRRMMTRKVTDEDKFMSLSSSAQALYLHLSMNADDDGFCNQITICMFRAHASVQDLEALLEKRYIYQFENGVIVIKHWRMANALRKDRYTPTIFQSELSQLGIDNNGVYTWLPDGCQMVATDKDRLDKDRLEEIRVDKVNKKNNKSAFIPPTVEEVRNYCESRNNGIDAEEFVDFYTSKGWIVGKNSKMANWQAAVRTWERNSGGKKKKKSELDEWAALLKGDSSDGI